MGLKDSLWIEYSGFNKSLLRKDIKMTYLIQNGFITTQTQIIFKKRITMKAIKWSF